MLYSGLIWLKENTVPTYYELRPIADTFTEIFIKRNGINCSKWIKRMGYLIDENFYVLKESIVSSCQNAPWIGVKSTRLFQGGGTEVKVQCSKTNNRKMTFPDNEEKYFYFHQNIWNGIGQHWLHQSGSAPDTKSTLHISNLT